MWQLRQEGGEGDEATVQVTTHSVAAQTRLKQFVFHRVSRTLNSPRYEVIIATTLRNLGKTLDLDISTRVHPV